MGGDKKARENFRSKSVRRAAALLPSLLPWLSPARRRAVGRGPPPPSVRKSSWGPANTTAAARPPSWPPVARAMGGTLRRPCLNETPKKKGKVGRGMEEKEVPGASHNPNKQSKREVLGAAALYRPNGRLKVTPPKCPEDGPYTV